MKAACIGEHDEKPLRRTGKPASGNPKSLGQASFRGSVSDRLVRSGQLRSDDAGRVAAAAAFVPELVRMARKVHGSSERVKVAVLVAWSALAGVIGWSREMVDRIELEMDKR